MARPPRDRSELSDEERCGLERVARAARAVSPPRQVAEVKAIACELPVTHGLPLGRFSRTELHRLVIERGVTGGTLAYLAA